MIMIDRSRRLAEPLRWGRREKTAVAVVAALVLAVVLLAVFAFTGPSGREGVGCIDVSFASTLGGADLHACGRRARELCASPASNPGAAAEGALRASCRRAGVPYGPTRPRS
jgi:hypothetical protein